MESRKRTERVEVLSDQDPVVYYHTIYTPGKGEHVVFFLSEEDRKEAEAEFTDRYFGPALVQITNVGQDQLSVAMQRFQGLIRLGNAELPASPLFDMDSVLSL